MSFHRSLALVLAVALTPAGLRGQEPQEAREPLTLDQAVQETLSHNASLRAARASAAEDSARVTEVRSAFFPRVSVAESWQRGDDPVFVFSSLLSSRRFGAANFAINALNQPDPVSLFRGTVGVDQLVFDGGRQRAAARAAALQRDIADLTTNQAAADLALSATETFSRILAAQAAQRAADAGLAAAREDLARAERRRDAGMLTEADVLGLAAYVADLQQRAMQSQGDAAVALAQLNRLMGAPIDRDRQIVEPSVADAAAQDTDVSTLLAEAEAARPELRRAAAAEQLAEAGRRAARAGLLPQVAAQAAFEVSGNQISERASSWIVGGELRWSFSTGGAERARVAAAGEAASRAGAELDDVRAAVQVDVVSALRRGASARARQDAGRAAVAQARESQRIIRDRFDAGLASVADVLRASTAVQDAEVHRVSALVDALTSHAQLRRALGRNP
jgi:outer membrane protein